MSAIPFDPFTGKELRLGKFDQGIVIYSVGPDGIDNGGKIERSLTAPGTDVGIRLWDVQYRRQPAKPLKIDAD
jgi:hypothetical protein